jgi:hypothetical protein
MIDDFDVEKMFIASQRSREKGAAKRGLWIPFFMGCPYPIRVNHCDFFDVSVSCGLSLP